MYERLLRFQFPLVRGEDVLAVQQALNQCGHLAGEADGLYGPSTESAVKRFQQAQGLRPDGQVGPLTWRKLFSEPEAASGIVPSVTGSMITPTNLDNQYVARLHTIVNELKLPNRFRDSVGWQLTDAGISIDGAPPLGTPGEPVTVDKVWRGLRNDLTHWSAHYGVPVELIMSTICTESSGNLTIRAREEPGYVSDDETPHRVSPGIMQTLISTAREAIGKDDIDRAWLEIPGNSIQAGTAYIARQWKHTHFNPPKVACAYNAGGVYYNDSSHNRWKMRQYPIGTGEHADRFVKWFNDVFTVLGQESDLPQLSFFSALRSG